MSFLLLHFFVVALMITIILTYNNRVWVNTNLISIVYKTFAAKYLLSFPILCAFKLYKSHPYTSSAHQHRLKITALAIIVYILKEKKRNYK